VCVGEGGGGVGGVFKEGRLIEGGAY